MKISQVCLRTADLRARKLGADLFSVGTFAAVVFAATSSRQVATAVGLFISRVCDCQGYSATECVIRACLCGRETRALTCFLLPQSRTMRRSRPPLRVALPASSSMLLLLSRARMHPAQQAGQGHLARMQPPVPQGQRWPSRSTSSFAPPSPTVHLKSSSTSPPTCTSST